VALVVMAVCWVTVGQGSDWLYRGGFGAYALLSTAVVAASVAPGPVRRIASMAPLRAIGLISYGVYLYHWPLFLWLSPSRTGLSRWPLFGLRLLLTFAAAITSYFLIEQPVRKGHLPGLRALIAAPVAAVAVIVALLVGTVVPKGADRLVAETTTPERTTVPATSLTAPAAPATAAAPLRVLMVGDSVGYDAEPGIVAALTATGAATVAADNRLGFGLTNGALDWRQHWSELVGAEEPGLVVLLLGGWDEGYIETDGLAAYTDLAAEAAEVLTAGGARLLILGYPITVSRVTNEPNARRSVEAFAALPARFPGQVAFQSLDPALSPDGVFVEHLPGPDGARERVRKVDGTHFCPAGAARIGRLVLDAVGPVWSLPDPPPAWRSGEWAKDRRFVDPQGACPP
jgi:hypothetical protein